MPLRPLTRRRARRHQPLGLMIGVELAPLRVLERADVSEVADRLLDQLIGREEDGTLGGPVVH